MQMKIKINTVCNFCACMYSTTSLTFSGRKSLMTSSGLQLLCNVSVSVYNGQVSTLYLFFPTKKTHNKPVHMYILMKKTFSQALSFTLPNVHFTGS